MIFTNTEQKTVCKDNEKALKRHSDMLHLFFKLYHYIRNLVFSPVSSFFFVFLQRQFNNYEENLMYRCDTPLCLYY